MRTPLLIAALAFPMLSHFAAEDPEPGPLVVVGGGGTPGPVLARALDLAGGEGARVVVLPQASSSADRGASSARMFREAGAAEVVVLDGQPPAELERALATADLVWLSGGSQVRLVEALGALGLVDDLRAAHARGAVVGGTSAGAAAQSARMITGEADLEAVKPGATELVEGLGLWEEVIVDQHFVTRRRNNRLLSAVLDTGRVGVGIDERTAVIVGSDGAFEVLGDGVVLVYDPRGAQISRGDDDVWTAAVGLGLHVLRAGMVLNLDG